MLKRRRKARFKTVVHVFNPSGLGTCVECGKLVSDKIHLRFHPYTPNYSSKLERCMCGYNKEHSIHVKGHR